MNTVPSRLMIDGRPMWVFPDGTVLPVVSGGAVGDPVLDPATGEPVLDDSGVPVLETEPVVSIPVAPPAQDPPGQAQPTFTADDLAKARKEEKDKLYPQIEELKRTAAELLADKKDREKAAKKAQEEAERAAKAKEEAEMEVRDLLARKEQEWNDRFESIRREQEMALALAEKQAEVNRLMQYRNDRLQEEAENIMPELIDFIGGNTEQEIEESIARAVAKTGAILGNITAHAQQQRAGMRGASVTAPPVGPLENQGGTRQLTPEDIRNMPPTEYAANRDALLSAAREMYQRR